MLSENRSLRIVWVLITVTLLSLLFLTIQLNQAPSLGASSQAVTIKITEKGFEPPLAEVTAGETVTWVNETDQPVTLIDRNRPPTFLPVIYSANGSTANAAAERMASTKSDVLILQTIRPGGRFSQQFDLVANHALFILEIPDFFGRITVVPGAGGQVRGFIITDLLHFNDIVERVFRIIYLPDISVFLRDKGGNEVERVRTDLSGRFSFPHQKAGTYTLCWEGKGFVPGCSKSPVVIKNKPLHVGDIEIAIAGANGFTPIYGKVRFADHSLPRTFEPFANVNAFAMMQLHDADDDVLAKVYVNNHGDYLFPQAPVERDLWVNGTTEKEVGERRVASEAMQAGLPHRVDIRFLNHRPVLEPLQATVAGKYVRVVDPKGKVLLDADANDADGDVVRYRWILPTGSGELSDPMAASTEWQLPDNKGKHRVEVIAYDGRGGYTKSSIAVETTPDGVLFSGQIVEPGGSGVPNAQVNINGKVKTSDANGFFQLRVPQSSQYLMNVHKTGYALLSRIYVDGQTGGRWTLTPATVVSVDPTKVITVKDDNRVCLGAVSQRIPWQKYPNAALPRYQDGSGEVVRVGAPAVDFEDLTLNTTYVVKDTFVDSGVTMVVQPFVFSNGQSTSSGFARVDNDKMAGHTGQDLEINNANIAFDFDGERVSRVTIYYGDYGGNVNLWIDGKLLNVEDFDQLDGETAGDVKISVDKGLKGLGQLHLDGPVRDLAIGGQEFWIDHVVRNDIQRLPREPWCGPGMLVRIPANSLVDQNGKPPPGNVNVSVGTYDILSPDGMPGDYSAASTGGDPMVAESFGAGEIVISSGATTYDLKPGAEAQLTLPVAPQHLDFARPIPANIPNLVYNEKTGIWEEDGEWTLAGQSYSTTVDHFSAFNTDLLKEDQACIRIASNELPSSYRLEVTIPQGTGAAPKVTGGVVDNSVPFHVVYNLPTNETITLVAIQAAEDIPIGTFVVDSGGPQNPVNPNRPDYPYSACENTVVLYDPELSDPPSAGQNPANSFLHGLTSFYATAFDETEPALPINGEVAEAFAQSTADYYTQIDPHDLRDTLAGFIATNNIDPLTEEHGVYVNSADLGFGRDMHCTRQEDDLVAGEYDVACYVSNYGDFDSPDTADFVSTANQDPAQLVATVAMEYTRIEDPVDVNLPISNTRVTKFYVYGANGQRVDGTDGLGNVDTTNAFVDLDGFGGRPLPQLCFVCHGGQVNYDGSASATNPPVFNSFADVNMGSVFLHFDLLSYTIVDGVNVDGVVGLYDKSAQQTNFRLLNQDYVLGAEPGAPIEELIDYFYPPVGLPGIGNQDEDFVVSGWNTDAAHQAMYENVMTPACRNCHVGQVNSLGPTFATAAEAEGFAGLIRLRVCNNGVMPHARATYDRFWTSIDPHQPAQLIAWGSVYAPGLDWSECATASPDVAPPIPDVVYHDADIQPIWDSNCSFCHVNPPNPGFGNLDLTPGNAYAQLVNHASSELPSMDRVEPFDENDSYLWHKLNGTQGSVSGSGDQMPPPNGVLTPLESTLIMQWIEEGAAESE